MSISANPVAPNLKSFKELKRMENRLVPNVAQKRSRNSSRPLVSHPEGSLFLPLREMVVLLVDINTAIAVVRE
jgi:hypothetical protein